MITLHNVLPDLIIQDVQSSQHLHYCFIVAIEIIYTCTLPVKSVPITTKVVSSSPTHGRLYSIQHYAMEFVSDLSMVFSGTPVSSTNKTDHITEILLKVALSTINHKHGRCDRDRYGSLQLHVQSVPITTKVVSSNPSHGKVYSIQHYVIKFVSDLCQVCGFLRVFRVSPPIKLTAMIQLRYC